MNSTVVPASAVPQVPRSYRAWIVAVQSLLVVGWAMYVLFLPSMLRTAGIDPRLAIAILMLDQAIFAVSDWAAGMFADRITRRVRRIGPLITLVALVSSAAMLAMPFIAQLGSPTLFLVVVIVWTATSSALRAPVFALLGRVSGIVNKSGPVGWALVSLSIAGALMPLVTTRMQDMVPGLPLAIGALALAAAALFAAGIESRFPAPAATSEDNAPKSAKVLLALVILLGAIGTQVHTTLVSKAQWARVAGADGGLSAPTFWVAFALALPFAVLLARRPNRLANASIAMWVGALALIAIPLASSLPVLILAQAIGGAAWGITTTVIISAAFVLGGAAKAGTAAGMVFAAFAMAALIRLGFVAMNISSAPLVVWVGPTCWLLTVALLFAYARRIEPLLTTMSVTRAIRGS